jgi:hypothetical protein
LQCKWESWSHYGPVGDEENGSWIQVTHDSQQGPWSHGMEGGDKKKKALNEFRKKKKKQSESSKT